MVAAPFAEMDPAVVVKLAVDDPAGMLTEGGTGSRALVLDRVTVASPFSVAPDSVTAQELDCPETRVVGLHAKLVRTGPGTSWTVAACEELLYVARIVAVAADVMVPAVAVKLAAVEPAVTITEAGTGSRALLLDSVTVAPALNGDADSVTVQELDCPEPRVVGLQAMLIEVGDGGTSWTVVVCEELL
jgi:hypothetical protein